MKFYVYVIEHRGTSWEASDACSANHFELVKTNDIEGFIWEQEQEHAQSYGEPTVELQCEYCGSTSDQHGEECCDEEMTVTYEQEWNDFVEENAAGTYFPYDPELHASISGYEDERPEHLEWVVADKARRKAEKIARIEAKILDKASELQRLYEELADAQA